MAEVPSGFLDLTDSGFHMVKDGCKIYYEVHGSGPQKIVFIQGLQTSLLTWKYQVEYFVTDPQKRYQVLLIDNRGYGRSGRPAKLSTTRRLAKDVHSVLKNQLKWSHYHLVGQSLGGMIATELAMLDTPSLLSLTLVVTHAGGLSAFPPFDGLAKLFLMILARNGPIEELAGALLPLQYPSSWLSSQYEGTQKTNRQHMTEFLVEDLKWGCPSGIPPVAGAACQISAIARHYVSANSLARLSQHMKSQGSPILVIVGAEDSLVRIENSEILRNALDCPLVKVDTSGHMIHLQVPHVFNSTLQSHFETAPKELAIKSTPSSSVPLAKL